MPLLLTVSAAAYVVAAAVVEALAAPRGARHFGRDGGIMAARLLCLAAIFAFWLGLLWRPVMAATLALSTVGALVAISRAKQSLLGEPLHFLDLPLIPQALRHPRLYYGEVLAAPARLAGVVAGVLMVVAGLVLGLAMEPPLAAPHSPVLRLALWSAPLLLFLAPRFAPVAVAVSRLTANISNERDPGKAVREGGLLASMLAQYCGWLAQGFQRRTRPLRRRLTSAATPEARPHLVAVQCESFVEPGQYFDDAPALPEFREAQAAAARHGALMVPAGGAYTMRTEFAFLTGASAEELGLDSLNPYVRGDRWPWPSLARSLAAEGYATDFVHPHDLRFFRRDRMMPALGFEHLHGPDAFREAARHGPYVSDAAVGEFVMTLLTRSAGPRFVFAVTMENHGPWASGRLPAPGLTARQTYYRHLENADRLIGMLRSRLASLDRPVVFCFYGDHSPLLPFDQQPPAPATEYFIDVSRRSSPALNPGAQSLAVENLGGVALELVSAAARPDISPRGGNRGTRTRL